ncbi:hypothetical protein [Chromobacterium violaceum]|uniref:hypothetical protein n=1 Tax=Chromobacterium violaceum TaxID=536 RepID=UPI001B2FEE06|nr:hypothetical protein [Chromobacterium violaceum]
MGEINIPRGERDALKAVDIHMLGKLIEQCLQEENPRALRSGSRVVDRTWLQGFDITRRR